MRRLIKKHLRGAILKNFDGTINNNLYNSEFNERVDTFSKKMDAVNAYKKFLRKVENSYNKNFNYISDRWYPHKSREGGADTIAYGFKLLDHKNHKILKWVDLIKLQGYLDGSDTDKILNDYIEVYMNDAKNIYDKEYGNGAFDRLSINQKIAATDILYNGGLGNFPKFMLSLYNNDLESLIKQSRRYINKKPLGRNKIIEEMLRLNTVLMTDLKPTIYITR